MVFINLIMHTKHNQTDMCSYETLLKNFKKNVIFSVDTLTLSNCDCPEPCSKTVFEPTQSSAVISKQNSASLLGNAILLHKKYLKARDTQDHVITKTYVDDLKVIKNISRNYRSLHQYVKFNIMSKRPKAMFQRLQNVLNYFSTNLISDRNGVFYQKVQQLMKRFDKELHVKRLNLWEIVDTAIYNINILTQFIMKKLDVTPMVASTLKSLHLVYDLLMDYDICLTNLSNDDLPDKLTALYKCASNSSSSSINQQAGGASGRNDTYCLSCVEGIVKLFKDFSTLIKTGTFNWTSYDVQALRVSRRKTLECLDGYYDILQAIQSNANSTLNTEYDNLGFIIAQARAGFNADEMFASARQSQLR